MCIDWVENSVQVLFCYLKSVGGYIIHHKCETRKLRYRYISLTDETKHHETKLKPKNLTTIFFFKFVIVSFYLSLHGAPLKGKLLAIPTNIRLAYKGLPGTSTRAYFGPFVSYEERNFYKVGAIFYPDPLL